MCGRVDQITLSTDTNGRQNVVPSTHDYTHAGITQLLEHTSGCGLEFVLEDDKTDKIKIRFDLFAFHLLDLHPVQFLNVPCCARNDTVSLVGVIR